MSLNLCLNRKLKDQMEWWWHVGNEKWDDKMNEMCSLFPASYLCRGCQGHRLFNEQNDVEWWKYVLKCRPFEFYISWSNLVQCVVFAIFDFNLSRPGLVSDRKQSVSPANAYTHRYLCFVLTSMWELANDCRNRIAYIEKE